MHAMKTRRSTKRSNHASPEKKDHSLINQQFQSAINVVELTSQTSFFPLQASDGKLNPKSMSTDRKRSNSKASSKASQVAIKQISLEPSEKLAYENSDHRFLNEQTPQFKPKLTEIAFKDDRTKHAQSYAEEEYALLRFSKEK